MQTIFRYPLSVQNKGWVIVGLLLFFPIGLLALIYNTRIHIDGAFYRLNYRGSCVWLLFWSIFFFPIAWILLILNGVDVCKTDAFPL